VSELFALGTPEHTEWLEAQTESLLRFYENAADFKTGGFDELSNDGQPLGRPKMLYGTARMTYSYALGHLLGHDGSARLVEHGLRALRHLFHDDQYGGWVASVSADGSTIENGAKQTYGHAFVLLAAAAAREAGFDTDDLIDEATSVFARYLYDADDQLCVDSWDRSWRNCDKYRGLNANMHAFESFLGAHSATGKAVFVERARAIGARMISFASETEWRIPEHFTAAWEPLPEFNVERPADQFRPYGVTPGHGLEWARLLLQLDTTSVESLPGALDAAERLFDRAVVDAFDERRRGFAYTVDWRGRTVMPQRLHWPLAEAIGAARCLYATTGDTRYSDWYQRFWQLADSAFIDHEDGSWWHELDVSGMPSATIWEGKGDLYHSLQATLFGQFPVAPTLIGYLARRSVSAR
jgi:sulfoquinovose isomerase